MEGEQEMKVSQCYPASMNTSERLQRFERLLTHSLTEREYLGEENGEEKWGENALDKIRRDAFGVWSRIIAKKIVPLIPPEIHYLDFAMGIDRDFCENRMGQGLAENIAGLQIRFDFENPEMVLGQLLKYSEKVDVPWMIEVARTLMEK